MLQSYRFSRFEVRPAERALLIDGLRAELGSRAFDVLQALLKHRDRVVTKDELLAMVWPGLVVEENNLQAQVSALRKLLGPKAIATIPGRGYQFSLSETVLPEISDAPTKSPAPPNVNASSEFSVRREGQRALVEAIPSTLTHAERAAVLGWPIQVAAATHVDPLSIVVLPFANLTGDPCQEYFSDGIADQLLNVLAKIKGLRVIARTSSFSFKGKNVDIATIGARLGVRHVLEGSVRKSGNRVRISVQLVKVADSSHLWSESYDRTLDDIFAVQDDIARAVMTELRARLINHVPDRTEMLSIEAEVATAIKGRSRDSEAHRLYLHARFLMNRHAAVDVAKSIDYLRQALAIDPNASLVWAALCHALVTAADLGAAPVVESAAEALKAVQRALELEPDLVNGHVAMCTYQTMCAWNWSGALDSAQRALRLAPDDVGALKEAARLYYALGRSQEAYGFAECAIALDPLNSVCYWYLASALGVLGRLVDAEAAIGKALELSPDAPSLRFRHAYFLDRLGRHEEALVEANREREDWGRLFMLGILHFRHGNRVEADLALNTLIERCGESACIQIAMNYCVRGEADHAFEWLERAYQKRDTGLSYLKSGWLPHPITADPRWPVFLKKMGFDESSAELIGTSQ